jgi:hypothetical protein
MPAPAKFAIAFSTYKRPALMCRTLSALRVFTECARTVAISADDCSFSEELTISNYPDFEAEADISLGCFRERVGIAKNKNNALLALLARTSAKHIIVMEDDVRPFAEGWEDVLIETALHTGQKHLLYMPEKGNYGLVKKTEGLPHRRIEWKQMCSGLIMYFSRDLLEKIGLFDERFGLYGWEHNELTARALVAQGIEPNLYPHCAELEYGNYILSDDAEKRRATKPQDAAIQAEMARKNKPLYDRLMTEHMQKLAQMDRGRVLLRSEQQ